MTSGPARYVLPAHAVPPDDPLPRRRLLSLPAIGTGIGGRIKDRPEDFLVDEEPLYHPRGDGEHLYIGVQKRDMPHSEMIEVLSKHFGVGEESIGFAGMKDRVAITRQTVSIHLPGRPDPVTQLEHERLAILWQKRHINKLRRGHLAGNRFSIRIRGIDPSKAPVVWAALKQLEKSGIPDYFGAQRFGYRRNTHRLGRDLTLEHWDGVLAELLGTRSPYPEHQRVQRELFEQGRFGESLPLWGRHDRSERVALAALAQGKSARQAVLAVQPHTRAFWVSALQSAIFNRTLDRRLDEGLLDQLVVGDVALKHVSGGQFPITEELVASGELAARLDAFEISPSGPLPGPGMIRTAGEPFQSERAAAEEIGVSLDIVSASIPHGTGTRRPFRVRVSNVELDAGVDEHGSFVRVAFDLPKGAYATVLLREILGDEVADQEDAPHLG
ncbi:MAG: tRNA pseudouridine(13) synthase TruD [Phycisphaerae bacterium]|nr:tRNA pseudouridine(13) synthase TruD [Phycisphaerae bacterium]